MDLEGRAQRVTVFGFTRKSAATSAGVRSASGWVSSGIVCDSFQVSVLANTVREGRAGVHDPYGLFLENHL